MPRQHFYVESSIADRFRVWCREEGIDPNKTIEEVMTHLSSQPIPAHRDKAGLRNKTDARKPWELPPFYGDTLTSKWSRDQELLARLKTVRDLFHSTDESDPLSRSLQVEVQRLERVLNLSSVRYRGEVG